MLFDKDAGHTSFLEDVYECQSRYPGGQWGAATVPWADVVRGTFILFRHKPNKWPKVVCRCITKLASRLKNKILIIKCWCFGGEDV